MMKKSEKKISKEYKELTELKNQLVRALADYDNLRKRVEAEREAWAKFSSEKIALKMIGILDILEAAQNHLKDQGLAIAILEFKKVLNEEGIVEIRPQRGEAFDHGVHEAVESVDMLDNEKDKKGTIAELVLPGWMYATGGLENLTGAEKVIRFAKVKVYSENVVKN